MLNVLLRFSVIVSLLCTSKVVVAESNVLKILDQEGNPVVNAVVSIQQTGAVSADVNDLVIMDQVGRQFLPRVLVVEQGQQVSFPNSDNIRHHVYSFSAIKPFEIKLYKGSEEAPVRFEQSGVGVLGCNIHDNMVGFVYVAHNEIAKVTNPNGLVQFEQAIPEHVMVWHESMSLQQTERRQVNVNNSSGVPTAVVTLLKTSPAKSNTFGSKKFGQKG